MTIRFITQRTKRAVGSPEGASCWGEQDLAGSPKGVALSGFHWGPTRPRGVFPTEQGAKGCVARGQVSG